MSTSTLTLSRKGRVARKLMPVLVMAGTLVTGTAYTPAGKQRPDRVFVSRTYVRSNGHAMLKASEDRKIALMGQIHAIRAQIRNRWKTVEENGVPIAQTKSLQEYEYYKAMVYAGKLLTCISTAQKSDYNEVKLIRRELSWNN